MASASLSGLSASVTRILSLTGFPKELKTKDIQNAFSEWEGLAGGFKIKWKDDTSLLIVFQDASVAKRAYLTAIANPPPSFTSSVGLSAVIRPYDGPDAQSVIQNVNSRGQGHHNNASRSANRGGSISVVTSGSHGRAQSMASGGGNNSNGYRNGNSAGPHSQMSSSGSGGSIPEYPSQHANNLPVHHSSIGREPSPTLPSLPSHPTLNALINSSLGEGVGGSQEYDGSSDATGGQSGPRIGDPGKRIIGAALGVRHPGLPPRMVNGGDMPQMHRAMAGLTVAEH